MKRFHRLFALALSVVLCAFCFASCGGSGTNYAASNTEYFIGGTGPLTGDASSYGISVQNGAQLAIDEINANGGLNGVLFHFEMKDDQAGEEAAATGYTALYESGMQLSIGSVTSGSCASFADRAKDDGVLFISPSASAANVIATSENAFRVCFGDPQQGTLSADTLVERSVKVGVIYDTSDPYSTGLYTAFELRMTELGKVKDTDYVVRTFDKDSNKDFSTQVAALADAGCETIYTPIYYTEAGLIAKAAAAQGFNVPIFGNDGLDGVADQLSSDVTANVEYITPFDVNATDDATVAFVTAYEAKYGSTPDQFAADGYDAVMILYAAMQKAGISDVTMSASAMADLIRPVLTSADFSYTGLTGSNMTWSADGSCNKDAKIVKVQ
ncbi:MAG: ABC transporter substrate-binding protein [Clostridia bacterium]|nr:ABC transporter substrate-binding protein [Clostridia bacterium]